jgi:hypothetical protein
LILKTQIIGPSRTDPTNQNKLSQSDLKEGAYKILKKIFNKHKGRFVFSKGAVAISDIITLIADNS